MSKKDERKKEVAEIILTMLKGDAELIKEVLRRVEKANIDGGPDLKYKETRKCLKPWLISEMLTSANLAATVRLLESDELEDDVLMKLEKVSKYMHTEAKNLEKYLINDDEEE